MATLAAMMAAVYTKLPATSTGSDVAVANASWQPGRQVAGASGQRRQHCQQRAPAHLQHKQRYRKDGQAVAGHRHRLPGEENPRPQHVLILCRRPGQSIPGGQKRPARPARSDPPALRLSRYIRFA